MIESESHIDALLVKRFVDGDTIAMAELVKRWHLNFCEKAFWLVKDKDMAKDIAQDSWKTIVDKLHTLENPNRFKYWALRIVYNKSMDALKLKQRQAEEINKIAQEESIEHEIEGDNSNLKKHLLKAIGELSSQQQQVLKLFYTQDYSMKEISQLLHISVGTVKSRLFHSREALKQKLKTYRYEN